MYVYYFEKKILEILIENNVYINDGASIADTRFMHVRVEIIVNHTFDVC